MSMIENQFMIFSFLGLYKPIFYRQQWICGNWN